MNRDLLPFLFLLRLVRSWNDRLICARVHWKYVCSMLIIIIITMTIRKHLPAGSLASGRVYPFGARLLILFRLGEFSICCRLLLLRPCCKPIR